MEFEQEVKIINDMSEYVKMKEEVEKTFFKLLFPQVWVVLNDEQDPMPSPNDPDVQEDKWIFELLNKEQIKHILGHKQATVIQKGKKKTNDFFTMWSKDPKIKIYNRLVYKPTPQIVKPGEYNTWQQYEIPEGKLVDISNFHRLIKVLTNNDKKSLTYLLAWISDMIQNPGLHGKSHGKCPIFRGEQGSGKSTLYFIMKALLGSRNCFDTPDIDKIVASKDNRFAGGAVGKILVCLEEACSTDTVSKADKVKDLITNTTIKKETKNIDGFATLPNYSRIMVCTNHKSPITIEESDRRYFMFNVSSELIGNVKFWDQLHKKDMKNKDWLFSVYQYLNNIDIKNFDFSDRPITEAYQRCRMSNIPYVTRFLATMNEDRKTLDYLYEKFQDFVKENSFKYVLTKPSFKSELKELEAMNLGLYKVKNSVMKYYVNVDKFKEFCKKKKYDLFEDDDIEEEEIIEQKKKAIEEKQPPKIVQLLEEMKPKLEEQVKKTCENLILKFQEIKNLELSFKESLMNNKKKLEDMMKPSLQIEPNYKEMSVDELVKEILKSLKIYQKVYETGEIIEIGDFRVLNFNKKDHYIEKETEAEGDNLEDKLLFALN